MNHVLDALRLSRNPIAPYWWEAEYAGGLRVPQLDPPRVRTTLDLDATRIEAFWVHGVPGHAPIRVAKGPGVPDQLVVLARRQLALAAGVRVPARTVRALVGFRHGDTFHGLRLGPTEGRLGVWPWAEARA